MTITDRQRATFGAGGAEPYAGALRRNDQVELVLTHTGVSTAGSAAGSLMMDVALWSAEADEVDRTLLRSATGPLLDIGCGPGRMVQAALDLGLEVLGIDVSPTAVAIAQEAGLPVIEGSIFETVPGEGTWQTVLLVDGNIGIGGNVRAMLERCVELAAPDGEIVIEVHADRDMNSVYTARLVGTDGGESASFPWAQIGITAMADEAERLGLRLRQVWELAGRTFCRLAIAR